MKLRVVFFCIVEIKSSHFLCIFTGTDRLTNATADTSEKGTTWFGMTRHAEKVTQLAARWQRSGVRVHTLISKLPNARAREIPNHRSVAFFFCLAVLAVVVVVVVFLVNSIFIGKQNGNAGETEKALTTEPSESNRTAAANEIKVEKKNKKQKNETRTTTRPVR